jgi:hypothetical protein
VATALRVHSPTGLAQKDDHHNHYTKNINTNATVFIKVNDLFWQGSIKEKGTQAEVDHTLLFRRLADVRQASEQLVAELSHSTEEPDEA